MNEVPNKIIPNSFQTPNFFVDGCMVYLTGNEFKCLAYLARKTFGWQKRTDRISKSQIATYTGLNNETVDKCMETLVGFGLVVRVAENNIGNDGVEWALQTDDSQVRFDLMQARQAQLVQGHRLKTEKARLKKTERGVGMFNNPRVGLSNNLHKSHLKPKKRTWALTRPRALLCQHPNSASKISLRIAGMECGLCLRSSTCCRRKNQPPQPKPVTLDSGSTAFVP